LRARTLSVLPVVGEAFEHVEESLGDRAFDARCSPYRSPGADTFE
jgi:hypothetical protein